LPYVLDLLHLDREPFVHIDDFVPVIRSLARLRYPARNIEVLKGLDAIFKEAGTFEEDPQEAKNRLAEGKDVQVSKEIILDDWESLKDKFEQILCSEGQKSCLSWLTPAQVSEIIAFDSSGMVKKQELISIVRMLAVLPASIPTSGVAVVDAPEDPFNAEAFEFQKCGTPTQSWTIEKGSKAAGSFGLGTAEVVTALLGYSQIRDCVNTGPFKDAVKLDPKLTAVPDGGEVPLFVDLLDIDQCSHMFQVDTVPIMRALSRLSFAEQAAAPQAAAAAAGDVKSKDAAKNEKTAEESAGLRTYPLPVVVALYVGLVLLSLMA